MPLIQLHYKGAARVIRGINYEFPSLSDWVSTPWANPSAAPRRCAGTGGHTSLRNTKFRSAAALTLALSSSLKRTYRLHGNSRIFVFCQAKVAAPRHVAARPSNKPYLFTNNLIIKYLNAELYLNLISFHGFLRIDISFLPSSLTRLGCFRVWTKICKVSFGEGG